MSDNCTLSVLKIQELREKLQKKVVRLYQRSCIGMSIPATYLLVTLTAPDGIDVHNAWRKFVLRCSRRSLKHPYFAVKERNKRGVVNHIHAIFRAKASDMECQAIRYQWSLACGQDFCWTYHKYARAGRGMAAYLAKYVSKQIIGDGFLDETARASEEGSVINEVPSPLSEGGFCVGKRMHCYWYSQDWVHTAWQKYSRILWRLGYVDKLSLAERCEFNKQRIYYHMWRETRRAMVFLESCGMYLDSVGTKAVSRFCESCLRIFSKGVKRWQLDLC